MMDALLVERLGGELFAALNEGRTLPPLTTRETVLVPTRASRAISASVACGVFFIRSDQQST